MYLKSIEIQGFKSFANKIVLEFHNGITGIVGPNGSGKSNVSDAVRWVLGEQSAKQLRGSSMQDVIFAGTENRKPLSYAYVAITMDNADHTLDIAFEEVTVARRVYRSGESEYLINGRPCRLREVQELFYDTGIGKEGYSIIGQGQIERILSGRPEERRELFDEAAGIVKYKRRKATAQKKLETERENLVRINDILSELERQVQPLERQAEKARIYLKKKEEQKTFDVNAFLLEIERIEAEQKQLQENDRIVQNEAEQTRAGYEKIRKDYEQIEAELEEQEKQILSLREQLSESSLTRGRMEGEIGVLKEKVRAAGAAGEQYISRIRVVESEYKEKEKQKQAYEKEQEAFTAELAGIAVKKETAGQELKEQQNAVASFQQGIEQGKNERLKLLEQKASLKARQQKTKTLMEQARIRKAEISKQLLEQKSEDGSLLDDTKRAEQNLEEIQETLAELSGKEQQLYQMQQEWQQKLTANAADIEESTSAYHKAASRLETLRNIAERYDGYGSSIRRVMEQKEREPGILGVVSDLIKVEKKYETAIETALGGSIQNIVTEDEETAKRLIGYLKQNRFGRATFLPLTAVRARGGIQNPQVLQEPGVIGTADTLVEHDGKFDGIVGWLLGRVIVADQIDHAAAIARKYHYSLNIVTLEGESLRPGGSMTGGAFKHSGNLLARNREIEELEQTVTGKKQQILLARNRREELLTAQALQTDELEEVRQELQKQYVLENTAKMELEHTRTLQQQQGERYHRLQQETTQLDHTISGLEEEKGQTGQELLEIAGREAEIEEAEKKYQASLEEQRIQESAANRSYSEILMEEAGIRQKQAFTEENITRVSKEQERCILQKEALRREADAVAEDAKAKQQEIARMEQTIFSSDGKQKQLQEELTAKTAQKEALSAKQKGFFGKREEIAGHMQQLDKEILRLENQKEKAEQEKEAQTSYMWEEYELTLHGAMELRDEAYRDLAQLRKEQARIKAEIRELGDVNVNAIEEYKEVSQRYSFLKTQHDDLIEAEAALVKIIEELDTGMRQQFTEKFAEIQREFDRAFKELFGGGKGTLELVEDEDLLECGIRIIAQPPGKKLQNMILLSGGEKSLTAIALLFAIQNLKPSPFCLLDEIEAALDDSNVGRFAQYLHKLTRNTQFIVITHRRGTMAAADRLYGITMQEKGVSTLVSVDLIEHDLDK